MKLPYGIIPFFLLLACSCARGQENMEMPLVHKSFTIAAGEKTTLDGDAVAWEKWDRIAVWDGTSQRKFETQYSGASTTITGEAADVQAYSMKYPFCSDDKWGESSLSTHIPVSQKPGPGGFDSIANVLCAFGVSGDGATLLNACGLVRFSLSGNDVTSVRITSTGGENFCGHVTITPSAGSISVSGADYNSILVEPSEGKTFKAGNYAFLAAPSTLSGIEIRIAKADGSVGKLVKTTPLTITRAGITTISTPFDEASYETVSSADALTDEFLSIDRPHPYLFADDGEFERHRAAVQSGRSNALVLMHKEVMAAADRIVKSGKDMKYELDEAGKRILNTARDFFGRVFILSYAYRYSGLSKYLEESERLLGQICSFSDWNAQRHYLDPSTICQGVAVSYDWLYKDLNPSLRARIEQKVFDYYLGACLTKGKSYLNPDNGWNQTVTAGMIMGAVAFQSVNPSLSTNILKAAIPSCYEGIRAKFGPDGSYPSGTNYWVNATQTLPLTVSTLLSVYGSDMGITDYSGYRLTPNWYIWMRGNTNQMFSFGDSGTSVSLVPGMFYFSALYDDSSFPYFELLSASAGTVRSGGASTPTGSVSERVYPLFLLWASRADALSTPIAPIGRTFSALDGEQPVAAVRTGWGKNDLYLAIKGGDGVCNHAHLDAGSICFDAWGQRWAADAVQDSYAKIEAAIAKLGTGSLWDVNAGSMRWKCFSINNRQHSTITVNDTDHYPKGNSRVTEVYDEPGKLGAKVDFKSIFKDQLKGATRTAVIRDDSYLEVTDHIEALDTKDALIRWNLCSKATSAEVVPGGIKITAGGESALLSATSKYPIEYAVFTNDPKLSDHPSPFCEVEDVRKNYTYCGFYVTVPAGKTENIVVTLKRI